MIEDKKYDNFFYKISFVAAIFFVYSVVFLIVWFAEVPWEKLKKDGTFFAMLTVVFLIIGVWLGI